MSTISFTNERLSNAPAGAASGRESTPRNIRDTKEFANQATINLFKKKTNLRPRSGPPLSRTFTRKKNNVLKAALMSPLGKGGRILRKSSVSSGVQNNCILPDAGGGNCTFLDMPPLECMESQHPQPSYSTEIPSGADPSSSLSTFVRSQQQPQDSFSTDEKPKKSTSTNDDLTSLSWLQSLDMGGVVPHLAAPPTPPASPPFAGSGAASPTDPFRLAKEDHPPLPQEKIDYSVDGSVKPPFSYAALIGMAMKQNQNKMTLSAIYKWIKEHYIYYKTADQSWQVMKPFLFSHF